MKRQWKVGVIYDTLRKSRGHHGLHFAFSGLPDTELILADPNDNDLDSRMAKIGATKRYTDYHEMVATERPDIVIIGSRTPDDHFEEIKAAAECGCHILCEKPFSANLEEADKLAALTEKHKVNVAVAHLARYSLVFRTMKRMIERGDIGTPLTFYGRGKEDERGGGEDMMVLGTHILDIGSYLFGKPEKIYAEVTEKGRPITQDDRRVTSEPVGICAGNAVMANLTFANGVKGIFESREGLYKDTVRMGVTVAGTEGTLSMRYDMERKLRISRSTLPPEDEASYEEIELREDRVIPAGSTPLDYENYGPKPSRYFADCNRFAALDLTQAIEEGRQPAASVYDGVNVLEMIYAIYRSSLECQPMTLPLVDRTHPMERN